MKRRKYKSLKLSSFSPFVYFRSQTVLPRRAVVTHIARTWSTPLHLSQCLIVSHFARYSLEIRATLALQEDAREPPKLGEAERKVSLSRSRGNFRFRKHAEPLGSFDDNAKESPSRALVLSGWETTAPVRSKTTLSAMPSLRELPQNWSHVLQPTRTLRNLYGAIFLCHGRRTA